MKKIIQLIGGIFVAAILVIAVTAIYQNKIIPELKTDAFKSAEKKTNFSDEKAFYEAVSYHPVFEYTGGTAQKTAITYNENNQATAPSVKYSVLKDICVTDKKDDYEKTPCRSRGGKPHTEHRGYGKHTGQRRDIRMLPMIKKTRPLPLQKAVFI